MGPLAMGRTLLSAAADVDFDVSQHLSSPEENLAEMRSAWARPFDFAQGRLRPSPHSPCRDLKFLVAYFVDSSIRHRFA